MTICLKNIQEENRQGAFPKLRRPQKPFSWNIYFPTHQILTEYLSGVSAILEAKDTAVNEVGRIPVYILLGISNEQTKRRIPRRSRRQREIKQDGKYFKASRNFCIDPYQEVESRVPIMAQQFMNPTSIHEDAGSIPGFAQGLKDLVLL